MLPWLIGAAAVAVAGAILSDDKPKRRRSDDGDAQREKLKAQKKARIYEAKEQFKNKWSLSYNQASERNLTPKKIKNLYTKRDVINKNIDKLNSLLKQI